ncbi:GDP-mannose 4,6-dehydratase [Thiomonas sp.]|jgi:nucleoside-diphosphate-sugar epimerase|uniref:NAD-dependent epimerase/dehydratase family protein n=1 Tax=Thiomonas sp. TaxID=2047785 RepID=UPI00260FEDB0|nr:GDP-mannose 4,6-dehydratase [Thiomonas sp.]
MTGRVVLVTGAGGFTGRHLVPALRAAGYRVVGLGREGSPADTDVDCDLRDPRAVREAVAAVRPTHVVHLAALAFVAHADERAFYDVNLFGCLHLLDALHALPQGPRKVLIASSANVYGTPGVETIDETVCPAPVNHYACSKLAMEHMVRTWFGRLPIVLARPFNYTGVGQSESFLIPKIVKHFTQRAERIQLGNLDVSRDFSDVRDVVSAYVALLESEVHSETFNVCSGRAVALRDLLQMVGRLTGHALRVEVDSALVRKDEIASLRGSHQKLSRAVGFTPRYSLEQTLAWMATGEKSSA